MLNDEQLSYITVHTAGLNTHSHYALIGMELIEAIDTLPDGAPDWDNGSICDPYRGDHEFFHATIALLTFLNRKDQPEPAIGDVAKCPQYGRQSRSYSRGCSACGCG